MSIFFLTYIHIITKLNISITYHYKFIVLSELSVDVMRTQRSIVLDTNSNNSAYKKGEKILAELTLIFFCRAAAAGKLAMFAQFPPSLSVPSTEESSILGTRSHFPCSRRLLISASDLFVRLHIRIQDLRHMEPFSMLQTAFNLCFRVCRERSTRSNTLFAEEIHCRKWYNFWSSISFTRRLESDKHISLNSSWKSYLNFTLFVEDFS